MLIRSVLVVVIVVTLGAFEYWRVPDRRAPPPFDTWRAALVEEAIDRGFDRSFVEEALRGVQQPLPTIVELDRAQAEGPQPLDEYLRDRVTPELVAQGRDMRSHHAALLDRIRERFGVQPRFAVAIWGAETGYGRYVGDVPVLQALATLAWVPRRSAYFRGELFHVLTMLAAGHIEQGALEGSWAGAMGQPQFMPSSYLEYGFDFDEDGRADIWHSVADTLASIANYLSRFGWHPGESWGREVALTAAVQARVHADVPRRTAGCGALRSLSERRPIHEWSALGVRSADGGELPQDDVQASLLTLDARSFLVQRNYETLLAYNCSHRYALSVSLLADRIG